MLLLIGNQGMYQKFFSARSENDAQDRGGRLDHRNGVAGNAAGDAGGDRQLEISHRSAARDYSAGGARKDCRRWSGAILMGGIFAKVISTANNYLFSPATNLIHDVYERFINPNATERQSLIMSRVLVIGTGHLRVAAGHAIRIDPEGGAVRVHDLRRRGDAGGDGGVLLEADARRRAR